VTLLRFSTFPFTSLFQVRHLVFFFGQLFAGILFFAIDPAFLSRRPSSRPLPGTSGNLPFCRGDLGSKKLSNCEAIPSLYSGSIVVSKRRNAATTCFLHCRAFLFAGLNGALDRPHSCQRTVPFSCSLYPSYEVRFPSQSVNFSPFPLPFS